MSPSARVTLRVKLFMIVGIAALAQILLILASAAIARRVERQLSTLQRHYLPRVELQPRLEASYERLWRGFQDATTARDREALAATRPLHAAFLEQLENARDVVDPRAIAALRRAFEDYDGAAYEVSRRLIEDETGEGLVDAMAAMQAKQSRVVEELKKVTTFDRRELSEAFASVARAEAVAATYRLWISVACLFAVAFLSLWLSRGALRSLADLTAGFQRFGEGDFEHPVRVLVDDELGAVASKANQMAESLKRLGEEHQKSERKFRALLESAPDAMVIAGRDGRIILVNAQTERLFGYTRNDLVGAPVELLMPERYRSGHSSHRNDYFRDPQTRAMGSGLELHGRRRDGTEFPIEISLGPLETEEGTLVSSAIRDITQRKHIETALISANRELESFSYSVAHDLRTPLRGINGFSRAVLEDYGDRLDEEGRDSLQRICAAAGRMGQLIDALLTLSRVTRAELQRTTVDLATMAEGVVKQLRTAEPDRQVEFLHEDGIAAYGDAPLLQAVLENLLGNAWKFTRTRSPARIELGFTHADSERVYYVRDNGAGFDMAYADKLFAPFQRLHKASEFAGTGVGLATVQRIVRRHGGRIWAEGTVNHGAVFHFTLGSPPGASIS
jgi:PAS domain S-box-containing protein